MRLPETAADTRCHSHGPMDYALRMSSASDTPAPDAPTDGAHQTDTICAIATPPGMGGIGIVRISGPKAPQLAQTVCGRPLQPRLAQLCPFRDAQGDLIDTGLALYFPAPASFTGEHVVELQGHGGPVVMHLLTRRLLQLGARMARPGEFSERAFLNDKLDLAQAEAIADLIASGTEAAARAAQNSLKGVFSERVNGVQQQLTGMRVFVEAAIDFPDEEIDFLAESDILQRLQITRQDLTGLLAEARQGLLLRDGATLAIIGQPNAGKSSLLNALSGQDSAIVTEIAGTTRDVLREWIDIHGIPVHVADTAGIRETSDRIEAEGVRRARRAVEAADLVLLVMDATAELEPQCTLLRELPEPARCLLVANKCDLLSDPEQRAVDAQWARLAGPAGAKQMDEQPTNQNDRQDAQSATGPVWISATQGKGLDDLKERIRDSLGAGEHTEGSFSARQRHVDALQRAAHHLDLGEQRLTVEQAGELLAEELRLAQQDLGEITGELLADDLLGVIFSSFCIGK